MAERPVALPPVTGGEANASGTTDTSNFKPPATGLPKLFDGDGVDANQSRHAGIRDAHFLLPKVRQHGNQGFQNPVAASVDGLFEFRSCWQGILVASDIELSIR
jgi:hypothetical protein